MLNPFHIAICRSGSLFTPQLGGEAHKHTVINLDLYSTHPTLHVYPISLTADPAPVPVLPQAVIERYSLIRLFQCIRKQPSQVY